MKTNYQIMTADEIREVVRSELLLLTSKVKTPDKKGLWQFLNTGLGLWMLSSLFIGGITFAYSSVSATWAAKAAREERFARLDSELDLRFQDIIGRIASIRKLRNKQAAKKNQPPDITLELAKPNSTTGQVKAPVNHSDGTTGTAPSENDPLMTIDRSTDKKLTPEETKALFSKPTENEQYQMEFKDYTVKSLFAEGFFLSRDANEKAAINAALRCFESARIFERNRLLLEGGKLVPGGTAKFTGSESALRELGLTKEQFETRFAADQLTIHMAGSENFEDSIFDSWDFWHRRKSLEKSELPVDSKDVQVVEVDL